MSWSTIFSLSEGKRSVIKLGLLVFDVKDTFSTYSIFHFSRLTEIEPQFNLEYMLVRAHSHTGMHTYIDDLIECVLLFYTFVKSLH